MSKKSSLALLLASGLALAAVWLWQPWQVYRIAPNVTLTLLSGQKLRLADLRGRVTVLNFWATGCSTCIKGMPEWIDLHAKLGHRGLEIIALAMDYDPPMYVLNYAQTRQLPFKVAMDSDGGAARAFGVRLTPTVFILNLDGKIIKQYLGEPDWQGLRILLEKNLGA
jgi:peroxiredoxin